MCQNCAGACPGAADYSPAPAATATDANTPTDPVTAASAAVGATVQPGFTSAISVRLLPAREVVIAAPAPGCQPRGGGPGRPSGQQVPLPDGLGGRLQAANKAVVAWLTRDPANAQLFLADPVTALAQAGAELTRADVKALARAHTQVRQQAVLPPGGTVSELTVRAAARGKVSDPSSRRPTGPGGAPRAGCGC